MCKSKMAVDVDEPTSSTVRPRASSATTRGSKSQRLIRPVRSSISSSSSANSGSRTGSGTTPSSNKGSGKTSTSTGTSLSILRASLSESPNIYDFTEILGATNNFLLKSYSSSSSTACWQCTLREKQVIIFRRKLRQPIDVDHLRDRLSAISRSHHVSVIKLLGISISSSQIYLVYEFIRGSNLANCLRNDKNPSFTVLSTWMSRMQIAADVAHGLEYIQNSTGLDVGLVHNHIKSSSIIVREPSFNAKICHFATAALSGEAIAAQIPSLPPQDAGEASTSSFPLKSPRSGRNGNAMQFSGARGYMSPEFQFTGVGSHKSDVYAFGTVLLELLSGEEPVKFQFDKKTGGYTKTSVISTARAAMDGVANGDGVSVKGRVREWMDRRLRDSFPVEVAEKLTRLALECVAEDPDSRPDMRRVADKISKLYLDSSTWGDNMRISTALSVSFTPR